MEEEKQTFGGYLQQKRIEKGIILRVLADALGIVPSYLSDIEKNRRNPPEIDKLEKLADTLGLTEDERVTFFNLAGESRKSVPPDLPPYIIGRDYVFSALRMARDLDAGEEEWMSFVRELQRRKG